MKKIVRQPDQFMHLNNKCSFILRMWQEVQSDTLSWRASVENPETGKRIGFASLEQLFAFLIEFTETSCALQLEENNSNEVHNS